MFYYALLCFAIFLLSPVCLPFCLSAFLPVASCRVLSCPVLITPLRLAWIKEPGSVRSTTSSRTAAKAAEPRKKKQSPPVLPLQELTRLNHPRNRCDYTRRLRLQSSWSQENTTQPLALHLLTSLAPQLCQLCDI